MKNSLNLKYAYRTYNYSEIIFKAFKAFTAVKNTSKSFLHISPFVFLYHSSVALTQYFLLAKDANIFVLAILSKIFLYETNFKKTFKETFHSEKNISE